MTEHEATARSMCAHDNTTSPPAGLLCKTCGTFEDGYFGKVYVPTAVNAHDGMLKALKAVEWHPQDPLHACPSCHRTRSLGHADPCQLAAAIKAGEGTQGGGG